MHGTSIYFFCTLILNGFALLVSLTAQKGCLNWQTLHWVEKQSCLRINPWINGQIENYTTKESQ